MIYREGFNDGSFSDGARDNALPEHLRSRVKNYRKFNGLSPTYRKLIASTYGVIDLTKEERKMHIYSTTQIAEITGKHLSAIYRLEKEGRFPARRRLTPKYVCYLASEVDEWLLSVNKDYLTT